MDKSILLIDDDRRALDDLADALEERGYAPIAVHFDDQPDAQFDVVKPELVFVLLGSELAFEITETIRESADGAIVPIIFVGSGDESEKVTSPSSALSFGGDYYFPLPVEMGKVLAKVQTYVGPGIPREAPPLPAVMDDEETVKVPELHPPAGEDSLASASDALLEQIAEQESKMQAELEARRREEEAERARRDAEKREAEIRRRAEEEAQEIARQKAEEAERKRKQEEERARRAEEERLRQKEEERERREAEERKRREEEERARREEEDRKRREEEERARREEEDRKRREEEDRKRREEEERARQEEEDRKRREEEERARREEEDRKRREEEERARREEEDRKRHEEEERARREEEDRKRRIEEEVRRRSEEEERRRREAEERQRREAEIRRQVEEEARLEREDEERRKQEEEERQIRREAERKIRDEERRRIREEEERARREEEERRREEATRIAQERRHELEEQRLRTEQESQERAASARKSVSSLVDDRVFEDAIPTRELPGGLRPFQPESGEFEKGSDIATLLHQIWRRQVTGQVELSSHHHQKALFFERGHPVNAHSSQIHDRMEEYLYRAGKITRTQYQEVRVKGLRAPRKIASYLVTEGYLKPSELFEVVRGHLESILFSIFEFEDGEYRYVADRAPEDDRVMLDLHPRAIVVEGIRRKYTLPRLMERVGAPSSLLGPKDGATIDMDTLGLGPDDRQVVRLVDGTRNIEDIVFSTGLGAQRVYQVLAALLATESAEVLVRGIEGVNPDGTSAADDIDRSRIREKYEHIRNADYFHILGVSRRATPYEVDRAFDRNRREYSQGRFSESIRGELEEELAEIEQVLLDARDILSDESLRDAYARNLP